MPYLSVMPTDRRFLVARYRHRVVIREVTAESCSYTVSRTEAWDRAKRHAKGAPRSQNPFHRKQASVVEFVGLDMSVRQLNVRDFLPREQSEPTPEPTPVANVPAEAPSAPADAILKALVS